MSLLWVLIRFWWLVSREVVSFSTLWIFSFPFSWHVRAFSYYILKCTLTGPETLAFFEMTHPAAFPCLHWRGILTSLTQLINWFTSVSHRWQSALNHEPYTSLSFTFRNFNHCNTKTFVTLKKNVHGGKKFDLFPDVPSQMFSVSQLSSFSCEDVLKKWWLTTAVR